MYAMPRLPEEVVESYGPELRLLLQKLRRSPLMDSKSRIYWPTGTVAYKGTVPPEAIKVVAQGARFDPAWTRAVDAEMRWLYGKLSEVLADYLRRQQRPPWWIR